MDCQIFMSPGFFGFTSYGSYNYFNGIKPIVEARLKNKHGIKAAIFNCRTKPTASFTKRSLVTIEEILEGGGLKAPALHFIGHSTGGLDLRLLLTPGVSLRNDNIEIEIRQKTLSLTTVSTPHYGTPIASFFTTVQGKHILNILTAMASNKRGRQAIYWSAQAAKIVSEIDDYLGLNNTILDEIAKKFIKKLTLNPEDPFWAYLKEVQQDQGALYQLMPEGMNLFNAAVTPAQDIDRYCVVSATQRPKLIRMLPKLRTPVLAGSMALFHFMQTITSKAHNHYPYPVLKQRELDILNSSLPFQVNPKTNDGVCPSLSQLDGELIAAAQADHLDIVGQFARKGRDQKYADWIVSGSNFNEEIFTNIWEKVADKIAFSHNKKSK